MKFLFLANKYMVLGDALFEAMGKVPRWPRLGSYEVANVSQGYSPMMRTSNVGLFVCLSE